MSSSIFNNYDLYAETYAKLPLEGAGTTGYLAFRDIFTLLKIHLGTQNFSDLKLLDYGCGVGRSTRFLKKYLGFKNIVGVDVNNKMIAMAQQMDPLGQYEIIESAKIPVAIKSIDLVFSSFVIVEIATKSEIGKIFQEIQRILKKNGLFILVTTSENFFDPQYHWLSYQLHLPGRQLISGARASFEILNYNLTLHDYYWPKEEILEIAKDFSLHLIQIHHPIGSSTDGIPWKSESAASPYTIFIFRK